MPENDDGTLRLPERGQVEPFDWARVELGNIVRDKKDRMHTVLDVSPDGTKIKLQAVRTGEEVVMTRPAGPVDLYVPSQEECLLLLSQDLGARYLRMFEDREHTLSARGRFRMDPIPNSAQVLHNHLDMAHSLPTNDVLYRFQKGADKIKEAGNKNDAEGKKAGAKLKKLSMEELRQAHDEAHADPDTWPMAIPHHHAQIGAA